MRPHRRSNERLGALFPFDLDQAARISTGCGPPAASFGFTDILALHLESEVVSSTIQLAPAATPQLHAAQKRSRLV